MLKKVKPGDPFVIPASTFNAFVDAANDLKAREISDKRKNVAPRTDYVLVQNNSGAERNQFDILGLDGAVITPTENLNEFKNKLVLSGVTPTSAHLGRFAVLQEPIGSGKIGRANICGVSVCKVNVTNEAHAFAEIQAGQTAYLTSATSGSATILYKESGTGEKWAVVRLDRALPAMAPTLNFQTRELYIEGTDFPASVKVPFIHFVSGGQMIEGAGNVFHVHFNNSGIYSLAVSAILRTTAAGIGNSIYFYATAPGWEYTTHPVTITSADQQITATTLVPGLPGTIPAMTPIIIGIRFLYALPYAQISATITIGQVC